MYRLLAAFVIAAAFVTNAAATSPTGTEAQLVAKANSGDVDAMLELAFLHYLSIDTDGENSEALKWYRNASAAGSVEAMMQMSRIYGFNLKNRPGSDAEAKRWNDLAISTLSARAKQGDLVAETHLAYVYDLNSNSDNAIHYYRDAADKGSAEAMFELGAHFQLGWDVQEDEKEAVYWLLKAASNNHAKAMLYLSDAYEKGAGVEQSAEKAQAWRQRALAMDKSKAKKSESFESKTFSWPEN